MNRRPIRVPDHPPRLDGANSVINGKTIQVRFTSTRKQAQAILDEIDRQAKEIEAKTEKK